MMERIVGIGISESLDMAWADVDSRGALSNIQYLSQRVADFSETKRSVDANQIVDEFLTWAKSRSELRHVLEGRIKAVGFSSIGRVSREKRRLERLMRKNWQRHFDKEDTDEYLIDFMYLSQKHFPQCDVTHIKANNDASCVALAEVDYIERPNATSHEPETFVYITINEGVNIGVVHRRQELEMADHPEYGHVYPRPHVMDRDLAVFNACPSHGACYEALASGARIRTSWSRNGDGVGLSGDLTEFPDQHEAWDVMAYYIAQLCVAAHAIFYPNRIIIGGTVIWGNDPSGPDCPKAETVRQRLFPRIWAHYVAFRSGYPLSKAGPDEAGGDVEEAAALIQRGVIHKAANAFGGMALARTSVRAGKLIGV